MNLRLLLSGLLLGAGALAQAADTTQARVNYTLNCQGCHLPDGRGYPGKVPDIRHSMGRFLSASGGREYLVRVPGSATSTLDSESLAGVLNWMLGEFCATDLPQDFAPYTRDEVTRLRAEPYTDVMAARSAVAAQVELPAGY